MSKKPKTDVMESSLVDESPPETAEGRAQRLNHVALDLALQRHEKMLLDMQRNVSFMINAFETLQNRFTEFERQRVVELQGLLKGGPTQRGD